MAVTTETVAKVEAAGAVAGIGATEADARVEEGAAEAEAGIVAAETVAALGQRWGELQKLVLLAELLGEQQHAVCCAPYLIVHGGEGW